jgi:ADP-ribose pyrophosphatase YjhB (NUDIX family)
MLLRSYKSCPCDERKTSIAYLIAAHDAIIYTEELHLSIIMNQLYSTTPAITRDFTATTFVVHENRTLLLLHRKLGIWVPPGGHIDPNELPDQAALREVLEESGLEVELLDPGRPIGSVRILPQPYCILLENISQQHQHIDMIYFARVRGGIMSHSVREVRAARWYTWEELGEPQIAEDIRELGRRAIESYRA